LSCIGTAARGKAVKKNSNKCILGDITGVVLNNLKDVPMPENRSPNAPVQIIVSQLNPPLFLNNKMTKAQSLKVDGDQNYLGFFEFNKDTKRTSSAQSGNNVKSISSYSQDSYRMLPKSNHFSTSIGSIGNKSSRASATFS
jgi:hypothetical protein